MRIALLSTIVLLTACGGIQPVATPELPTEGGVLAGFDTRTYPGADAMQAWRRNSPYFWVGYYLPAPCYTGTSWVGKRAELTAQGWGTAVLFVGEQDWRAMGRTDTTGVAVQNPRCTTANLTEENARLHANAADSTVTAEGFEKDRTIFLDIERVDSVSAALSAYVRAWSAQLLANGRYLPGLYVHDRNAAVLSRVVGEEFARARRGAPFVWIAKVDPLFTDGSRPQQSGFLGASIWQGIINRQEVWGGVTLTIDINVASRQVPGLAVNPPRNRGF